MMLDDSLDQIDWQLAWLAILDNVRPMSWNLFLAVVPLALSCVLFRMPRSHIIRWGIGLLLVMMALPNLYRLWPLLLKLSSHPMLAGCGVLLVATLTTLAGFSLHPKNITIRQVLGSLGGLLFVLFLPNAIYVVTDVVHFVLDVRKGYPMGVLVLIVLPQYLLFVVTGLEAYVVAVMNVGHWLRQQGRGQSVGAVELTLHALSAVGVYLGRFGRLNSWDLVLAPGTVLQGVSQALLSAHAAVDLVVLWSLFTVLYWLMKRITIGLMLQRQVWEIPDGR